MLYFGRAHGKSLNDYVEKHQDSSKNALRKSLEAAFAAWCEEIRADQAQYCADKVMILDCHARAWDSVGAYMESHVKVFCGRVLDGETTLMPSSRQWLREAASEVSNGGADDHCVVLIMSCPTTGIMSAAYKGFMISYIANCLKAAKLEETDQPKEEPDVKMDDDDDDESGPKRLGDAEELQVRDIKYNLETIVGNN
eukprot:s1382_g21.t1